MVWMCDFRSFMNGHGITYFIFQLITVVPLFIYFFLIAGILFSTLVFGPACGFILGSVCTKFYVDAVFVDTSEFQFIPFSVCGNTIHFYMSLYVNLFSTSNICVSADRAKMKGLLCRYETCHYVPLEILENTWKNRGRNANTDSMVCKLSLPVVVAGGDIREEDKTLLSISSLTIKRLGLSNKLHPEVSLITLIKLKVDSELH